MTLSISVVDDWPEPLLEQLSAFYGRYVEQSLWGGRYDSTIKYFHWKCAKNPVCPASGAFAFEDGRLVGGAIVLFRRLRTPGAAFLAGELCNLLIAPSYRGRGLFERLVTALVERCRAAAVQLLYCIPNLAGARALVATGAFYRESKATHRTWVLPLRPLGVLAAKSGKGYALARGDWLARWAIAAATRRRPNSDSAHMSDGADMRVVFTPELLDYRVAQHPASEAYAELGFGDGRPGRIIVRQASYLDFSVLLICRAEGADFGASLDAVAQNALERDCGFVALWAPGRYPFTAALARRLFVPIQCKEIIIAKSCCAPEIARNFSRWQIELLDSDKA